MDLVELQSQRVLSAPEFARLADVPPEAQWFASLDSAETERAYQGDLRAFMGSSQETDRSVR